MTDTVRDLIGAFQNPDLEANTATKERIDARAREGLTAAECAELLQAATRDWERPADRFVEPRDSMVWAAVDNPHPELVDVVRDVYAKLPTQHSRVGALRLLAEIGTPQSERAILDLALRHRGQEDQPGIWFAWGAGGRPAHYEVLFPGALALLADEQNRGGVLALLTDAHAKGLLSTDDIHPHADAIVAASRALRGRLKRLQRPEPGDWCWNDDYAAARADAGALLDVLGRCGGDAAVREVRAALVYTDPVLRAWAIASLVRLGDEVEPDAIEAVAEHDAARRVVARALDETGRLGELPERLRTQEAFARAEMVDWLTFPTELDHPPDEIRLEAVVDAGEHGTLYLFRFEDGDEWYAGVAGPYPAEGPPAIEGGGLTFSDFEPWESRSPAEHVQAILDALPGSA